jgi:ParB family chromosome partitioning protein
MPGALQRRLPQDLQRLDEAKRAIASARTIYEAKVLRDKAATVQDHLRRRGAALDTILDAAEIKLRAERRLGELAAQAPGQGRPKKGATVAPLRERLEAATDAQAKHWSSRWQRALAVPDEQFEAYVAGCRTQREEPTSVGVLRLAGGGRLANWSSESVEWYTPTCYLDAARDVLGVIDLDPASTAEANRVVGATRFFAREDDGLSQPWIGSVWLNPPYGEEGTDRWTEKLIAEHASGTTSRALLLVNAVTDRKWFAPLFAFPICFTDHRIAFRTPAGQPRSPVSGNAFVYFGKDAPLFARRFSEFGSVVTRLVP